MAQVTGLPSRAPRRTLAAVALLTIFAAVSGSSAPRRLASGTDLFQDRGSESFRTSDLLDRAVPGGVSPGVIAIVPRGPRVQRVAATLRSDPATARVVAPAAVSRDGRLVAVTAYVRRDDRGSEVAKRVQSKLARVPDVLAGGSLLASREVNRQVESDLIHAEAIAFPLLLLLALWIFRSAVAALLPLLVGVSSVAVTLLALRAINSVYPISVFALNLVTGAGLGLSIDYSLLLVSRFREELAHSPTRDALATTLATAGRTVAFSAVTVAIAFLSLLVFPLGFLHSMAIGGLLVAPLAGLLALTVLPAVFALLGPRVNALAPKRWQRAVERTARIDTQGGWYRFAQLVMRRPVPVALATAAALVALGLPFLGVRFTSIDTTVLPRTAQPRMVDQLLRTRFPVAARSALSLAVQGTASSAQSVARQVRPLPDVAAVRGPLQLRPRLWELRVYPATEPLSEATKRLVRRIRALRAPVGVTGQAARYLDTAAALGSRLPLALGLIATTTFLLLLVATRSIVLPLKALVMNFLSVSAAFGVLVLIFQDGRLQGLLHYESQGALELTQPVLLFAVVFGLSTDYGIFLLTRIREAWDAGLPNRTAVALGLERTGRIVTAAAFLFCVAVGAFSTSELVFVKELGVGIAAAVALDASLVRALLVPSLMALLGRWNWWLPSPRIRRRGAPAP